MKRLLVLLLGSFALMLALAGGARAAEVNVVYHMSDGIDQASRGLASIRNHLRAEPDTKIVVVALGEGIRFLLKGATERSGRPFGAAGRGISGLQQHADRAQRRTVGTGAGNHAGAGRRR
jgi:intracellular sulfur oxidation DsrE/DsrF family protein